MTIEIETRHYTVARDGHEDMSFTGQLLASGTDHENKGPRQSCWSEISIHKTDEGKYVVAQCYVTSPQNEEESHRSEVCESAQDVYDLLAQQDEDSGSGISDLAKQVLEEAAGIDGSFEGVHDQRS